MDEGRKRPCEDGHALLLSPPPSFNRNIHLFDNEDFFPDLEFVISGMDRPLRLHRSILAQTSKFLEKVLKERNKTSAERDNQSGCLAQTEKSTETDW